MMREILFRGQTRRKGEKVRMDGTPVDSNWVYGGVFQGCGDYSIIDSYDTVDKFPVYSDTVGQYTGLTDKRGTKVFEGDVMEFYAYGLHYIGVVTIKDGNASIMCKNASQFLDDAINKRQAVVVGNIHDNPELIGDG